MIKNQGSKHPFYSEKNEFQVDFLSIVKDKIVMFLGDNIREYIHDPGAV